jgi:hypothetical protein
MEVICHINLCRVCKSAPSTCLLFNSTLANLFNNLFQYLSINFGSLQVFPLKLGFFPNPSFLNILGVQLFHSSSISHVASDPPCASIALLLALSPCSLTSFPSDRVLLLEFPGSSTRLQSRYHLAVYMHLHPLDTYEDGTHESLDGCCLILMVNPTCMPPPLLVLRFRRAR